MTDFEAVQDALENKIYLVEYRICGFFEEYRFLSNYHKFPVEFEGLMYPSTEHAYQAAKSIIESERRFVQSLTGCGSARKAGQSPSKGGMITLRDDWDDVKLDVMKTVCIEKFKDPELASLLLATKPFKLIEGNWWKDDFWGMCTEKGKNNLGLILMDIRDNIL